MAQIKEKSQIVLELREKLYSLLVSFDFKSADRLFLENLDFFGGDIQEYEKIKARCLKGYFSKSYKQDFEFDLEQLEAIASIHKNTLVTARAGSGKTQVIAGKVSYLFDKEKIKSNQILVLSFNKKAAKEVNERIQRFGSSKVKVNKDSNIFESAITFHGLAFNLIKKEIDGYKILSDINKFTDPKTGVEKEITTNQRVRFIQDSFFSIYDSKLKTIMEEFLPQKINEFAPYTGSDEEYYRYRKNNPKIALNGDYIRSFGEKLLIDVLVEYGFEVEYERIIHIGNIETKPDITCLLKGFSKKIIIEHWGDFEKGEVISKLPIGTSISGDEYQNLKKKKIEYWLDEEKKGNCIFIQTYSCDIDYGETKGQIFQQKFLEKISTLCEENGKVLTKVSFGELIKKLKANHRFIYSFIKKVENFINKAQQRRLKYSEVETYIRDCNDAQERAFLQVSLEVYKHYREEKKKHKYLDFSDLLLLAKKKVELRKSNTSISLKNYNINFQDIKYIVVDEYQDFSTLFYGLLEEILKYNPECKLFVVGDSWQSINAFAGSELQYYVEFREKFLSESTVTKTISTNYRSKQAIVEMGNNLMKFLGEKDAQWLQPKNNGGEKAIFKKIGTSNVDNKIFESIFKYDDYSNASKCKKVLSIIIKIISENKGKKVMILSRNNKVFGYSLVDLREKLYKYYSILLFNKVHTVDSAKQLNQQDQEKFIKISDFMNLNIEFLTVHKSKGKEADIVILLDPSERNFPSTKDKISKDTKYSYIFEINEDSILLDERRLFYVAITRAKEKVYFIGGTATGLIKNL